MKKFWISFISTLLAAAVVITVGIGSTWFTNWDVKTWFNSWGQAEQEQPDNPDEPEEPETPGDDSEDGGIEVGAVSGNGIELMFAKIYREDFEVNGIMPYADSAVTISVTNANAVLKYKWSLAWKTAKSEAVSSYVQLSATEGTSVNVSALKAFDTQVILTCSAHIGEKPEVASSSTCPVDYRQRFGGFTLNGTDVKNGSTIELSTLVEPGKQIADVLGTRFKLQGKLGVGSLTGLGIPAITGTVSVRALDCNDSTSKMLPYESTLNNIIVDCLGYMGDNMLDGVDSGDYSMTSLFYSMVAGYTDDITFTINYECGSDSGTFTFYVNISDSLFEGFSAQAQAPSLSSGNIIF